MSKKISKSPKLLKFLPQLVDTITDINSLRMANNYYWKCINCNTIYKRRLDHQLEREEVKCSVCNKYKIENNNLTVTYPQLLQEWDYKKNKLNHNLRPEYCTPSSNRLVWWKCSKGHKWQASPGTRINQKCNCPYCSNHKIIPGENDFITTNSQLAKECDIEKNIAENIDIYHLSAGSHIKIWWKCFNNHSWKAALASRVKGKNCPYCNNLRQTSFGEQTIFYYLQNFEAINRYKFQNKEVDIYLHKQKIGIEFNGLYYHSKKKQKDKEKEAFLSQYMDLFYICEGTKNYKYKNKIYFDCKRKYNENLEWAINKLFNVLNFKINTNIKKDEQYIKLLLQKQKVKNSFAEKYPLLLKEWDYNKNIISPYNISYGSNQKIWWRCLQNHNYQMTINNRRNGKRCPYCSGQKVLKNFNDLLTLEPELCKEWDYNKNITVPEQYTHYSNKKVWWKCIKGHSWQALISNRTGINRSKCPFCH